MASERSDQQQIMSVKQPQNASQGDLEMDAHNGLSPEGGDTQPPGNGIDSKKGNGEENPREPPKEPHPYTRCWKCGGLGHFRSQCPTKSNNNVNRGRGGNRGVGVEIGGRGTVHGRIAHRGRGTHRGRGNRVVHQLFGTSILIG